MALASGTRLGAYEILTLLGSGGMGDVYRARDVTLNRLVAIKVLPAASASAPERRERFEREAQAVAALNHPNIVTIHSVEQADGHFFLTMELVEGRSLADALPKGGLPLAKVLAIAIPLADAVAAAHHKGITHRDLKPANIMIGDGEHAGRLKVLDFGLAKLGEIPLSAAGVSAMPTQPITGEGRIVGTVAYMSPEQAEGKPIDARSDLFSLGVILYEMATGVRPFTGDTSMSIISSILKDTPKSITELNPVLPPDLGRIVRRALAKDPERRYQTAKDFRNDLEELKAQLDSGELRAPTPTITSGVLPVLKPATAILRPLTVTAVFAVLVVAVAAAYIWRRHQEPPPDSNAATSLRDIQVTQLTSDGTAGRPAISPDGKYVAFIRHPEDFESGSSVWIHQIATSSDVQIVAPERHVLQPGVTITPDGNFVDYIRMERGRMELWRVSFLGGTRKKLADVVNTPVGWSPDGRQMAFVRGTDSLSETALIVADPDGGNARTIATRHGPSQFSSFRYTSRPINRPAWSPDGRLIALAGVRSGLGTPQVVLVDSANGSERTVAVPAVAVSGVDWLDAETLIVDLSTDAGSRQLWRLNARSGTLTRLTNDIASLIGVSLSATRDSLVTDHSERRTTIVVGDSTGSNAKDLVVGVLSGGPRDSVAWAADRVLFTSTIAGRRAISVVLSEGGAAQEPLPYETLNAPSATSDGRTIVFGASVSGRPGLWKVTDGGHPVQLTTLTASWVSVVNGDRDVAFLSSSGGTQSPWLISIDGGAPRQITNRFAAGLQASPADKTIAFIDRDEHGVRIYVICDLADCSSPRTLPTPLGPMLEAKWAPDGKGFAYPNGTPQNLWILPIDGKAAYQLTHFTDERPIADYAWSRDGNHLAIARTTTTNDIVLIKGLKR